jgi:hypothetical protein
MVMSLIMRLIMLLVLPIISITITTATPFTYQSYDSISSRLYSLQQQFPSFIHISTAHSLFSLPQVGLCGQLQIPCDIFIVEIANFSSLSIDTPQVYFSGEIHGDERVGPTTLIELATILVTSTNEWIRMLVNTRHIIITPMTNAIGYQMSTRDEQGIDTNRDYPIDQPPNHCMQAITSRTVNEIFRTNLIQLAVTFHGGMEAIAVEWGTKTREKKDDHKSPDDLAQIQTAQVMSSFAGSFPGTKQYPVGRMNDLVYAVYGGMEDWSYSGSWDPLSQRNPCTPDSFGGYPSSKTTYDDSMLRIVNILVETSDDKRPSDSKLGNMKGVIGGGSNNNNGHIARNIRLALVVVDMVQPWVKFTHDRTNYLLSPKHGIPISFDVGGSITINKAWLEIRLLSSDDNTKQQIDIINENKPARWGSYSSNFVNFMDRLSAPRPFSPLFTKCISLPDNSIKGDQIAIRAIVQVDSDWSNIDAQANPHNFPPQSHWVNARTNEKWIKQVGNHRVKGKIRWETTEEIILVNMGNDYSPPSDVSSCLRFQSWNLVGWGRNSTTIPDDSSTTNNNQNSDDITTEEGDQTANIIVPVVILSLVLGILYVINKRASRNNINYDRLPTVAHHKVNLEAAIV